jgi:hypothetical protein
MGVGCMLSTSLGLGIVVGLVVWNVGCRHRCDAETFFWSAFITFSVVLVTLMLCTFWQQKKEVQRYLRADPVPSPVQIPGVDPVPPPVQLPNVVPPPVHYPAFQPDEGIDPVDTTELSPQRILQAWNGYARDHAEAGVQFTTADTALVVAYDPTTNVRSPVWHFLHILSEKKTQGYFPIIYTTCHRVKAIEITHQTAQLMTNAIYNKLPSYIRTVEADI